MDDGRECYMCKEWKTSENFRRTPAGKLFSYCRPCHNQRFRDDHHKRKVLKGNQKQRPSGEDIKVATSSGRTCLTCDTWKSADQFRPVKSSGNLFPYCHDCWAIRQADQHTVKYKDPEYRSHVGKKNLSSKKRLRQDVLEAYGRKCACCGEANEQFLTLDHVKNDGAAHRAANGLRTGTSTWSYARKHNFPDIFQLLCWNCNSAKGVHGVCPHELITNREIGSHKVSP